MFRQQFLKAFFTAALFGGLSFPGNAQVIQINCSPPPQLDGIEAADEWFMATEVQVTSAGPVTTIACMHDSTNLYFLFRNNLESVLHFPEILIDVNNSKETTWQPDDWWFHVGAEDCENQGASDEWGNCQEVQPDWVAVPNIVPGEPYTDTVEIAIPFSKIGYTIGSGDSIGITFDVMSAGGTWHMYPSDADKPNPSTWATAVIICSELNVAEKETDLFRVYPNPSSGVFTISMQSNAEPSSLELVQTDGTIVWKSDYQVSGKTIRLPDELAKGNYLMLIHHANGTERELIQIY
ncbi:MAG TPA: T9SS type A sorting domain-containing protein [Fluviicola sp.]|nr:T9SS type A sorting domain-containing protein [Fluviicola sp.]